MKKFYKSAAMILIDNRVEFAFKVSEFGSNTYTYLTSSLFDITMDVNDNNVIWVEDKAGNWRRFSKYGLVDFKSHITDITNEQKQQ